MKPPLSFRRLVPLVQAHLELTKARLSSLVVVTAGTGYLLARSGTPAGLFWTVLGTFLAAAGAMALNEAWEVERDGRMRRTATRPLVTGVFPRWYGWAAGAGFSLAGIAILTLKSHMLAAGLGLAVIGLYVLLYTPLKAKSPFCTLVGAVCGALPPLMGWAGATGALTWQAWTLACLLFFWQIPHFLSLAWMYREDYRRGGFRMLPEVDPEGQLTARFSLLYALATAASALSLALARLAGSTFAAGALVLGIWLVAAAWRFASLPSESGARRLFRATLLYLPLVMLLSVVSRSDHPLHLQVALGPATTVAGVPPLGD